MNVLPAPNAIREIAADAVIAEPEKMLNAETPWVARGLINDWPLVSAALESDSAFLDYLLDFYNGKKVSTFLGEPQIQGRFFYNEDLTGFNFVQVDTHMQQIAEKLRALSGSESPPSLYMGSTNLDHWLPGLSEANQLALPMPYPLVSLWLGNRSIVAPHFDYPANIACCVAGLRRFTLFPPAEVKNLYVGPWDLTPAGQPISLVNVNEPDFEEHPRFKQALQQAEIAELQPGDVIYIPSLWWHQVESLAAVNGLVNYWWTRQALSLGNPMDAFSHALLSIKQLPVADRTAWRALFDYYVFSESASDRSYWPNERIDRTGELQDPWAKKLRAELINKLRR